MASTASILENSEKSSNVFSVNNTYLTDNVSSHLESTGSFLEGSHATSGESVLQSSNVSSPDVSVLESLPLTSPEFGQKRNSSLNIASNSDNSLLESPASFLESSYVTPSGSIYGTSSQSKTLSENSSLENSHLTNAGSIHLTSSFGGSVLESSFASIVSKISILS